MTIDPLYPLLLSVAALGLSVRNYVVEQRRNRIITAIEQNEKLVTTLALIHDDLYARFHEECLKRAAQPPNGPPFVSESLAKDTMLFANKLETWALYVLHGMADELVLFSTCGELYHELTVSLAYLSNMPREDAVKAWPFVYELADKWHSAKRKGIAPPTFARPIHARTRS